MFGNALWHRFTPLLDGGNSGRAPDPSAPEVAVMHRELVALMRDSDVAKVKLYTLKGLTVFSTEIKQIGEDKSDNPGIHAAAQGELASELTHRNQFSAFDRVIESRVRFPHTSPSCAREAPAWRGSSSFIPTLPRSWPG